jgi:hypothetical protein
VYVRIGDEPVKSKDDAAYFVAWIDRLINAAKTHPDWNNENEKTSVLDLLQRGRKIYAEQMESMGVAAPAEGLPPAMAAF